MPRTTSKTSFTLATLLCMSGSLGCDGGGTSSPSQPVAGQAAGAAGGGAAAGAAAGGGAAAGAAAGGGSAGKAGGAGKGAAGESAGTAGSAGTSGGMDTVVERSAVKADAAPSIPNSDYATFISHLNEFGLDLGQNMADSNKLTQSNVIYSPLSATYALAMLYGGAQGKTAAEMKTALGDTFADGVFHKASNRLSRELASRVTQRVASDGNVHKLELSLADALYVDRSLGLQPGYLDLLSREYDAGVRKLDFKNAFEPARFAINAWVSDQTMMKIVDLLPMGVIKDSTRIVLVNAIYFYGSWVNTFDHNASRDAAFHALSGTTVQVPTMFDSFALNYRAGTNYALAEFPYEGNHLRMTVVLPAAGQFESVRSQVSAAWLEQAVSGLANTSLDVQLPKFKMKVGSFSLTQGLKALGMKEMFTDQADLSGISVDQALMITEVLQQAFIAVDENGTEAAAATAVIGGVTSVAPAKTPFIVDRPFLFFIRDDNGSVLFSGQVVDPSL
jgi:serpin B